MKSTKMGMSVLLPKARQLILTMGNNKRGDMDQEQAYKEYCEREKFYGSFGYDDREVYGFILQHAGLTTESVLEIGTGKGFFTLAMARLGLGITSIDIAEEDQEKAAALLQHFSLADRVTFKIEDARTLSFSDDLFDVVISVFVLHHVAEPAGLLESMIRVVKPHGKIIISDFNDEGFRLIEAIHHARGQAGHPVTGMRISEAHAFLARKGYSAAIHSCKYVDLVIATSRGSCQ